MIINQIINNIKQSSNIAISFHVSPDGDSIGSTLALYNGLKKMGKNCYILSKEETPEYLQFLPDSEKINGECTSLKNGTDCVIVLDCGNFQRINGDVHLDILEKKKFTLINIDHHISNGLYGDLNYVDSHASATGEIIYQLLQLMDVQIDKEIASCLYTSILTDTGSFKHSSTTSVTHTIAGDLINTGINFSEIHRLIFDEKKYEDIKLLGKVLNNIYLTFDNKICVMKITENMLKSYGDTEPDTSEIISYGLKIDSVEVCLLLKEKDNIIKASLRSKDYVNVSKIAANFGGGGHIRASGLTFDGKMDEAENSILNVIKKEIL